MKKVSLVSIFLAFLYSGLILLGGGYVILPILQSEIVTKRNWITSEELVDYYALSQTLPGLISINISVFVGYKLRGIKGAISAILGITFFAFWAIVILSSAISAFTNNNYVQGCLWSISIAVVILIISAVREMWAKSVYSVDTFIVFLLALMVMLFTKISPVYVIIVSIFIGIVYKSLIKEREVS